MMIYNVHRYLDELEDEELEDNFMTQRWPVGTKSERYPPAGVTPRGTGTVPVPFRCAGLASRGYCGNPHQYQLRNDFLGFFNVQSF